MRMDPSLNLTDTECVWLSDFQDQKRALPNHLRALILQSFNEKPKTTRRK